MCYTHCIDLLRTRDAWPGRSIPGPAEYCRNMPWAENNSIYLPGAGRMPEGGRLFQLKMHDAISKKKQRWLLVILNVNNVATKGATESAFRHYLVGYLQVVEENGCSIMFQFFLQHDRT